MIDKTLKKKYSAIFAAVLVASLVGCTDQQGSPSQSPSQSSSSSSSSSPSDKPSIASNTGDNVGTITLDNTITYTGDGIAVDGSKVTISSGGDYTVTGTLSNGQIVVDTEDEVLLRLSGVNITCTSGSPIFFLNSKKSSVVLTEGTVNTLTDGDSYDDDSKAALFSNDTLEISGTGQLIVKGNYKHAIASDDDIIIGDGNYTLDAKSDGIHANDRITINGGNITISAKSDGIESEADFILEDGRITITNSEEGIEAKADLTINSGTVTIKAEDDALNAGTNCIINGGSLVADCEGDGLDSNGTMEINGGTITVFSGNNANGPLDTGDESGAGFTIDGGTVIALGGNMAIKVNESSTQYSIWIAENLPKGAEVVVKSEDGIEIASFTTAKSAALTFISSPHIAENGVYIVTSNGKEIGKVTMSSMSQTIGTSGVGGFGGHGGPAGGSGGQGGPAGGGKRP